MIKKLGENNYQVRVKVRSKTKLGLEAEHSRSGIKSRKEAERLEKGVIRDEALRKLIKKEQSAGCWGNIIEAWATAAVEGDIFIRKISRGTIDDYVAVLDSYTADWFPLMIEDIDQAMAWRLLDRVESEVSIARRKRLRTAIDAIFKWAIRSGKLKGSTQIPTEGFHSTQKVEEKMPEILNLVEIQTLVKSAFEIEHRWAPIWAFGLLTGMRSGELFSLTWKKVDLEGGIFYVHQNWTNKEGISSTKGRYWRTIPISSELDDLLRELKVKSKGGYSQKVWKWNDKRTERIEYTEHEFVLPRFQAWKDGRQAEILRPFCEGIGIPSIKFHTLRACFATQLIKDGVAPAIVMKIGGWKDLKVMQRYVRMAGVEVNGATENLKIMPPRQAMGRVVELYRS